MKGHNSLELNEATMIEAIQYWLNAQFRDGKAPVVKGVKSQNGMIPSFTISVEEEAHTITLVPAGTKLP